MKKLILSLIISSILFSCNEKKSLLNENVKTEDQIYLETIDSILPKFINDKDFVIVYRYGSIQWTPYSTVICIPKNDLEKEKLNLLYFMCNKNYSSSLVEKDSPILSMFQLKIDNPAINMKTINLSDLEQMDFLKFQNLSHNEVLGEGFCSNYYIIKKDKNVYILNKKTIPNKTVTYLKSIFRHISPMEYLQSLSLENDCDTIQNLAIRLREMKNIDTFNFAMIHDKVGRYW